MDPARLFFAQTVNQRVADPIVVDLSCSDDPAVRIICADRSIVVTDRIAAEAPTALAARSGSVGRAATASASSTWRAFSGKSARQISSISPTVMLEVPAARPVGVAGRELLDEEGVAIGLTCDGLCRTLGVRRGGIEKPQREVARLGVGNGVDLDGTAVVGLLREELLKKGPRRDLFRAKRQNQEH